MRERNRKGMAVSACWGNVVATKHLCQKSVSVQPDPPPHTFYVTDFQKLDENKKRREFSYTHMIQDLIYKRFSITDIRTAREIFKLILEDWMYGYATIYTETHYNPLMLILLELLSEKKPLQFLLPVFHANCSSVYNDDKGLGTHAHFAEFLALCTLVETVQKIQKVYPHGISVTIMAELQQLDACENTLCRGDYTDYHNHLKEMIKNIGAEDIIHFLDLEQSEKFDATYNEKVLNDYIRFSIHHHHPKTKKFPIDLYKKYNSHNSVRRTPGRHVVMFDATDGKFFVDHKTKLLDKNEPCSPVLFVDYNSYKWLLLKIKYSVNAREDELPDDKDLSVTMIKHGAGIIIQNKSTRKRFKSGFIDGNCLTNIIRQFGLVILRGFLNDEDKSKNCDYLHQTPDLVCVLKTEAKEPSVFELAPYMTNAMGTFEWA